MFGHIWPTLQLLFLLMWVPVGLGLISSGVAIAVGEWYAVWAFLAMTGLAAGIALLRFILPKGKEANIRDVMAAAALAWLVVAFLGALPFWICGADIDARGAGHFNDFVAALFESMSGITSTGLTVSERPDLLPQSLQWWRSFLQWIGGAGIVVLILSVVHPAGQIRKLYRAEARDSTVLQDVTLTARYIWAIYLGVTALGVAALWLLGMNFWGALNTAMTAVATGGFTIWADSLASFGPSIQWAVIILMVMGAVSFIAYAQILRRQWRDCLADRQTWALMIAVVMSSIMVYLVIDHEAGAANITDMIFQAVSAVTTSGFSTVTLSDWPTSAWFLLIGIMIIGGSAGSTSGGIKLQRAVTLAYYLVAYLKRIAQDPQLFVYHPGSLPKKILPKEGSALAIASILLVMWLVTIVVGSTALLFLEPGAVDFGAIVLDVTSAVSTVGISAGAVSPDLSDAAMIVFIALMWMGRLEILPILVLFAWACKLEAEFLEETSEKIDDARKEKKKKSASS